MALAIGPQCLARGPWSLHWPPGHVGSSIGLVIGGVTVKRLEMVETRLGLSMSVQPRSLRAPVWQGELRWQFAGSRHESLRHSLTGKRRCVDGWSPSLRDSGRRPRERFPSQISIATRVIARVLHAEGKADAKDVVRGHLAGCQARGNPPTCPKRDQSRLSAVSDVPCIATRRTRLPGPLAVNV